ncbi:hypothetical protein [uncultured Nevskia sp.]|uniref:hypothetical protein n=1 Tax=uncultured Nevskia sp. TaxID=228950 RepID=UPI0025D0BB52|nr:hypothetical protein [uncultured Nevskia sp.]
MRAVIAAALVASLLAACGSDEGSGITQLARQPGAPAADSLSARLIPADDLPPAGTRSLFDHLIAANGQIPYPFPKLVELIRKNDPEAAPPLTVLIPHGRSLLKGLADDAHPRVLAAADFQAASTPASLGLNPRGQLFLGFVENASEIEVLSYNEAAGRYEFQLVQNYCAGCIPKLVYAKRAICTTCHQGAVPIFPQRPWNETNGAPATAAAIQAARGNDQPYLDVPLSNPLGVPERFDQLTDVGGFIPATQRIWIDACGDSAVCRRTMLKLALTWLANPAGFDAQSADAATLRELQATGWPKDGIAVAESDLANRDPIEEARGFKGWLRSLTSRQPKPGDGAKTNEDLEAFDRLPKLKAAFDPLSRRPPKRMLSAADLDGVYGLAALFSDADRSLLESSAGFDTAKLVSAVDRVDEAFFAPAVYSRVRTMNALLTALGTKPLNYCCLDTAELSPPVASGEPPVTLVAGSPLAPFEQYCFACHRGNPAKKLNFMSGPDEAAVLANIKAKDAIREALDWPRYQGTDKANKLMPPADSLQHERLQSALAQNPKLLEQMRAVVPGMFDF